MRGQISIEYITIFGFVFLMTIPLIIIFFDQSKSVTDDIAMNQLRNAAIKITDKAETVYYLGTPSKVTLKLNFPEKVEFVNFAGNSIIFGYRTGQNNVVSVSSYSRVNMSGNVSDEAGVHYISIEAIGGGVWVEG